VSDALDIGVEFQVFFEKLCAMGITLAIKPLILLGYIYIYIILLTIVLI
jgi:hypothetical protein